MDRILNILLYISLFFAIYIDIKKKYIPNFLNIFIFLLGILYLGLKEPFNFFIAISTYSFPLILLYGYLSDFLQKEILGFGDIKLVISLAPFVYQPAINIFFQIYIFYFITFVSASIYILFLFIYTFSKHKISCLKSYELAFSPFLIISFTILSYFKLDFEELFL